MTPHASRGNSGRLDSGLVKAGNAVPSSAAHAAWQEFMRFCQELRFGEIEKLKIQDGLPVLAEVTKKKVRFSS